MNVETEHLDLHRRSRVWCFPAPAGANLAGNDGDTDVAEESGRLVVGMRVRLELQVKWWSLVKVDIFAEGIKKMIDRYTVRFMFLRVYCVFSCFML